MVVVVEVNTVLALLPRYGRNELKPQPSPQSKAMHLDDQNPFDIPLNTDSFIGIQKIGLLQSVYIYIYIAGSILPYIN